MTAPTDDDPATTAGAADDGGVAAVLEARVPGPELLAALSTDPGPVIGEVAEAGLRAGFALECHATWLRCRWLLEACRARAGTTKRVLDDPYAAQIAAATLGCSSTMAAMRLELAAGVLERLPRLGEEMAAGRLEERKAWHFVSILRDLDDETAREVVEALLGRAAATPHGKLADLIEAKAGELDPAWDAVRRAAAVARARVVARLRSTGAGEISGLDLPWETAKEAYDHLVAVADAVRRELGMRGITVAEGRVQSHVFLRLLGRGHLGADDPDIVARLVEELAALPHPDDPDPDDTEPGPDDDGPDGGPGPDDGPDAGPDDPRGSSPDSNPDDSNPDDSSDDSSDDSGPDDSGPDDRGPDDREPTDDLPTDDEPGPNLDDLDGASSGSPSNGPNSDGDGDGGPGLDDPGSDGGLFDPEPTSGPAGAVAAGAVAGAGRRLAYRRRVAVRLGLATLLGLDHHPGQMTGWGTVPAPIARHLADQRHAATWRLLLYTTLGALEHVLLVHPPGGTADVAADDPHRRQIVELTAQTTELEGLDPLDADACLHPDLVASAQAALAAARAHPENHPARSLADAAERHPRTALDTWIRARDRSCRFPGCDRPAHAADLDHTLAVTDSGITVADNLGPLCRRHHRLKHHPASGWTLHQPAPGTFVWTAPTGTIHVVEPDPVLPPPAPLNTDPNRHLGLLHAPGEYEPRPWTPRRDRRGRISDAAHRTAIKIDQHERRRQAASPNPFDDEPPF
ncbi:HNH endonuclease signature motif containing protein [Actinomycetospora atypica]|uniref:DUF222 domain-containing protein n=1 Tax=Actinomycetospora atypica TaxID=1290095 RepID=A0ABV9YGW0_9PSEU